MLKRKSHNKSRNGCQNCKKRHVKCDEQGPPCLNCVVRETTSTCVYSQLPQTSLAAGGGGGAGATGSGSSDGASVSNLSVVPSTHYLRQGGVAAAGRESPPPLPSSEAEAEAEAEAGRLMDLELMHRWSTVTYKTLVSLEEDHNYLQVEIPREALRTDFLLHGLLAITALEKAMTESAEQQQQQQQAQSQSGEVVMSGMEEGGSSSSSITAVGSGTSRAASIGVSSISNGSSPISSNKRVYVRAALEYYDRASVSFRAALANLGAENQHALFFFSIVAAIVHLLTPQCLRGIGEGDNGGDDRRTLGSGHGHGHGQGHGHHSAIEHAVSLFELLNGSGSIVGSSWDGMMASAAGPSIKAALLHGVPPVDDLDPDVDAALERLAVLAAATGGEAFVIPAEQAPLQGLLAKASYAELVNLRGPLPEPRQSLSVDKSAGPRDDRQKRRDMYRNMVYCLKYVFAEEKRAAYRFSAVGFPMMGGREFSGAVARREPLALLVVAYWGVLLGMESNVAWWTSNVGGDLVAEISEALVLAEMRGQLADGFAGMPEWRAAIGWARVRVGLPSLS